MTERKIQDWLERTLSLIKERIEFDIQTGERYTDLLIQFLSANVSYEEEGWRSIPGFPFYEASTFGRIRSLDRIVKHNYGGKCVKRGRILSQYIGNKGYLRTGVTFSGKSKNIGVHRLVCLTFHKNPKKKKTVNHKFGNKLDNRPFSVEWATHHENVLHAHETGLVPQKTLTKAQISVIAERSKKPVTVKNMETGEQFNFPSINLCAEHLKVDQSAISQSIRRNGLIKKTYKVAINKSTIQK